MSVMEGRLCLPPRLVIQEGESHSGKLQNTGVCFRGCFWGHWEEWWNKKWVLTQLGFFFFFFSYYHLNSEWQKRSLKEAVKEPCEMQKETGRTHPTGANRGKGCRDSWSTMPTDINSQISWAQNFPRGLAAQKTSVTLVKVFSVEIWGRGQLTLYLRKTWEVRK